MKALRHIGILSAAVLLAAALLVSACDTSHGPGGHGRIYSEGEIVVDDVRGQWTYISLREGIQVGVCALSDTLAQREWAQRTDWDIAICDGHIRTNGGISGCGEGGVTFVPEYFEEIKNPEKINCSPDSSSMEVW